MDPLSDIISLLELKSYLVGGFEAGGDWSIHFGAYDGIKCYAVASGSCWLAVEQCKPILLQEGDCILLPRGLPFRTASDLDLEPDDWRNVFRGSRDGTLVRLNDNSNVTVLGGHFLLSGPQTEILLGMLPPIVHLQSNADRETLRWALARMRQELVDSRPGNVLILQQLVYVLFIQALRLHLNKDMGVGWLFALSDKQIGAAIVAMHAEPARHWTVETLAVEAGMSRSGFAARFRQLSGETPIEHLTRWRMLLGGRSLSRGEPVGAVSRSLGYESESAFSTAYKRVMGSAPSHHMSASTSRPYKADDA